MPALHGCRIPRFETDEHDAYQEKRIDTRQIGTELAVRYVWWKGSVRRSGDHIRINAQLIDAQIDAHLWAERFDGDVSDLFAAETPWVDSRD